MGALTGKVALVTGGSRGIGAAIATDLAAQGATVAVGYAGSPGKAADVVGRIEADGGKAVAMHADLAEPDAARTLVERVVADLGGIDILVNNAGVFAMGPVADVTAADLDRVLAVHVRSVFLASQAAAAHMRAGGAIISIGSCLTERVPGAGTTLYSMSKAALTGLTKGLARELGPRGITVTVVQPGPIDTDMNPADGPSADFQRGVTALGHYGAAEDIAATVTHLAGPAGRYITGTAIAVDGGFAA
jgi:3-oxoacyl-[acyl-carrier protein] reductase